jgi:hypothetical protein
MDEFYRLHHSGVNALYYLDNLDQHPVTHVHSCSVQQRSRINDCGAGPVYQCNKQNVADPRELQRRVDLVLKLQTIESRPYFAESQSNKCQAGDR